MTFDKPDFGALAALWNQFHPLRYAVDENLLRLNSVECPVFDWGASAIYAPDGPVLGFAVVKKSAGPSLFKGPDPDQAHLSAIAFTDPVIGVDMLAGIKRLLRNRGILRLIFGQDCRHFFPGCPDDFPGLRDFLLVEGFEQTGNSFDVEYDLSGYTPPPGCDLGRKDAHFRRLGESDVPILEAFLNREFPGRWHWDTLQKIEAEGRPDFVVGLFIDEHLEGFAVTQDSSHQVPIGGAIWKQSLGPKWGALGPIGVSRAVRGKGLGDALLGFGLQDLKDRGVAKCLIDWTSLESFYGRHGFKVERRYASLALRLES